MPVSFHVAYERGANVLRMAGIADRYWSHLQQRGQQLEKIYNSAVFQIRDFGENNPNGFTAAQRKEHKRRCVEEATRQIDDLARQPQKLSPANTGEVKTYANALGRVFETTRELLTKL
ncbi:MAG TPA: hypothetical protein PLE04_11575 [Syntrophales bacterium]|nr:hypothetical protein [Syntrophales bacterium]